MLLRPGEMLPAKGLPRAELCGSARLAPWPRFGRHASRVTRHGLGVQRALPHTLTYRVRRRGRRRGLDPSATHARCFPNLCMPPGTQVAFNRASEAMTPDLAGVSVVLEGCSAADLPLLSVTCVSLLRARAGALSQGSRSLVIRKGMRSACLDVGTGSPCCNPL